MAKESKTKKVKKSKNKELKKPKIKVKNNPKEHKNCSKRQTSKSISSTQNKAKQKTPQTMDELLKFTGYKLKGLKRGDEVEGMITDISRKMVLVDVGAKTEGMVIDKEYAAAEDFINDLSIGDTIKVYIIQPENEKGQVMLSLKQSASDNRWQKVEELLETGETVKIHGKEMNKGGLIVFYGLLRGFVPASQFGRSHLGKIKELINKDFDAKIIEADRAKNRLIFSEKAVSEAEILEHKKEALKDVKIDEVYKGIISGIAPFGIFVRVVIKPANKDADTELSLDGLIHISEISWEKVDNLDKLYKVGQEIKVKALALDDKTGKLTLSIKRIEGDPWKKVLTDYPEGTKVKGEVTRLAAFGAFVNIEPGIDGLIHISKIPAEKEINVGDKIDCYIESIDSEQRRISLALVLAKKPIGYK